MMAWAFDALLAAGLLWLGWRTIASPSLFKAVVLFIVLGLLMTLCWARLGAPDVALAEAAIGTGLTGALLLNTYRLLLTDGRPPEDRALEGRPRATVFHLILALLSMGLVGVLGWALLILPEPAVDLGVLVQMRLDESGVSHPVTAVLLNFRGYDTLLEVAVLLLAILGVWSVSETITAPQTPPDLIYDSILVSALIRLLVPLATLIAGYLLWAGAHAPGGAFQAGAVLAAVGVLLRLTGRIQPAPIAPAWLRSIVALGLGVFSAVAIGALALGGNLLEYPQGWVEALIVTIESCLTISIALILTLLFSGAPGLQRHWP